MSLPQQMHGFLGLLAACLRQCYKGNIAGAPTSYLHRKESSVFLYDSIEFKSSSNK